MPDNAASDRNDPKVVRKIEQRTEIPRELIQHEEEEDNG